MKAFTFAYNVFFVPTIVGFFKLIMYCFLLQAVMSVNPLYFYAGKKRTASESDDESETRWGRPKLMSDDVIPESTPASSSVLSAPASGFSSLKGSVNTSPPQMSSAAMAAKKKTLFTFPNMLKSNTRFSTALRKAKKTDVTQTSRLAVDVLTQLQRKNDLPLPTTNTQERCAVWMSGCGEY